jgi:hypothetical protein
MLFGLVTTVCVEGKGARSTLGARSWKQRSMQIRLAKLCRVVSLARGQASNRSTGQDCRGATNMILAGRWPPVQLASDAQCYRERINRERAHRRPERPQTTATAVPLPYNVPNPMYSWKPLTRTQKVLVPLSPRGAEPRSFGRVDGAQVPPRSELLVPTMVPTTSVPFTQFSTKPFRVEYSTLPQRTPEHLDACSEMTQMSWFEPPLVMSRNYCEPRNVFNSYVEHSTASVARPAAIWPARAP